VQYTVGDIVPASVVTEVDPDMLIDDVIVNVTECSQDPLDWSYKSIFNTKSKFAEGLEGVAATEIVVKTRAAIVKLELEAKTMSELVAWIWKVPGDVIISDEKVNKSRVVDFEVVPENVPEFVSDKVTVNVVDLVSSIDLSLL
jgi:hypothetical protein